MSAQHNSALQFAPLRSLDDFVLESARFQVPSSDLVKWNNRIVKNLLYYQTNYMLLMGLFNIIMGTIHPSKIILGISIIIISVILIKYVLNNDEILSGNALSRQKSTIICVIVGFMILYFAGAIFVVALALLLPLTCKSIYFCIFCKF